MIKKGIGVITVLMLLASLTISTAELARPIVAVGLTKTAPFVEGATESGTKEEVVYAQLEGGGKTSRVYVVNIFQNQKKILDFGHYDHVRNMTSDDPISKKGDKITIKTDKERLCYQGNIKNGQLPWVFSIEYRLDGRYIEEEELAGKSGDLEIYMHVEKNKEANGSFYKTHTLQVSAALDTNLCRNIEAAGATKANAGGDKQLTWTILPGKEKDMYIRADVTDFEMKSISINAIKMNLDMDIDTGEVTGQFVKLAAAITNLDQGATSLSEGMDKFSTGAAELNKGSKALEKGLNQLSKKLKQVEELSCASSQIKSGTGELSAGLTDFCGQANYAAYKAAMAGQGLNIDQLQAGNNQAQQQLTAMIAELQGQGTPEALAQAQQLQQVVGVLEGNKGAISGMEVYLSGLHQGASQLSFGAKDLDNNYKTFDQGIQTMAKNLKQLDLSQSKKISNGIKMLVDNSMTLAQGSKELADGTGKLKNGTAGIDEKVQSTIDQIAGGQTQKEHTASFASSKNTEVTSVQFVIRTKAIQIEKETAPDETNKETTFLQKFLDLFRK